MLALVCDIIDNAKLDEGNIELSSDKFVLKNLFDEIDELFEI